MGPCAHGCTRQVWVEHKDWWSGEITGEWQAQHESWYKDIDLHRYKCTGCGTVFYYSQAARNFHEKGIKSDIKGLDGMS